MLGYTHATTISNDTHPQVVALLSSGVDPEYVFLDGTSDSTRNPDRPGLDRLLTNAEAGDTVIVWRLDCLGRSVVEVLDTVAMLVERGINVRSLQDGIDPRMLAGRQMVTLLVSLAKYERELKGKRIAAGMASARLAGTKLGRLPIDPEAIRAKLRAVEEARARGFSAAHAARTVGWSRATFYRHKQEHGSQK